MFFDCFIIHRPRHEPVLQAIIHCSYKGEVGVAGAQYLEEN